LVADFENNYFAEMCSGSEAGSYFKLIDYHSTLGLRVIKKRRLRDGSGVLWGSWGMALGCCGVAVRRLWSSMDTVGRLWDPGECE